MDIHPSALLSPDHLAMALATLPPQKLTPRKRAINSCTAAGNLSGGPSTLGPQPPSLCHILEPWKNPSEAYLHLVNPTFQL